MWGTGLLKTILEKALQWVLSHFGTNSNEFNEHWAQELEYSSYLPNLSPRVLEIISVGEEKMDWHSLPHKAQESNLT